MKLATRKALERALSELGVPEGEVKENPTKAGMKWLFGDLSPGKPSQAPFPSPDENGR